MAYKFIYHFLYLYSTLTEEKGYFLLMYYFLMVTEVPTEMSIGEMEAWNDRLD